MKANKVKDYVKVVVISTLCIALYSAGFIGINRLVFAAASSGTESIALTTAPIVMPEEITQQEPEGFQSPSITVYVPMREWHHDASTNPLALSAEEAAELGAKYIWEMFGISLDGKVIEMAYSNWPSMTRANWQGFVGYSMEEIENFNTLFFFTLDAVTGERIDIHCTRGGLMTHLEDLEATVEEIMYIRRNYWAQTEPPENVDEYLQIAKNFAAKHFQNSTVVSYSFENTFASTFKRNEAGRLVGTAYTAAFIITDDTGREARVGFNTETGELRFLLTAHNDIVPGYVHEGPGEG